MKEGNVRASKVKEAATASHLARHDPKAVRELEAPLHVAKLRCMNLRCRHVSVGIRKPDEWTDWRATACPKCKRRHHALLSETLCRLEVNAAVKIVRFRPVDPNSGELLEGTEWEYLPFEVGEQARLLLEGGKSRG